MDQLNFIDEMLLEIEAKEKSLELSHVDTVLIEIGKVQSEIEHNFQQAREEHQIIADRAIQRNSKLQERIDWLSRKFESFMSEQEPDTKTIDLPHGTLKIRKMPDKVEITDPNLFLTKANSGMLTVIPEQVKPDLNKIKSFIKMTTKIPEGVNLIEGREEFKLTLRKVEMSTEPSV